MERTKKRQRKDPPPFHKRQRRVHMTTALEVNSKNPDPSKKSKGPAPSNFILPKDLRMCLVRPRCRALIQLNC